MRGATQAHLFETDDGHAYVVKFKNNFQGQARTLVNEWLAARIFDHLGIAQPRYALVSITPEFLRDPTVRAVRILTENGGEPIPSGLHFGSQYHGSNIAVYDYLPDKVLATVENLDDFIGALVTDAWAGNTDTRQCVFARHFPSVLCGRSAPHPRKKMMMALMIDNGLFFSGPHWTFPTLGPPLYCSLGSRDPYFSRVVYSGLSDASVDTWVQRVESFPRDVLCEAYKSVPREWVSDEGLLAVLISRLYRRRTRVRNMVFRQLAAAGLRSETDDKGGCCRDRARRETAEHGRHEVRNNERSSATIAIEEMC